MVDAKKRNIYPRWCKNCPAIEPLGLYLEVPHQTKVLCSLRSHKRDKMSQSCHSETNSLSRFSCSCQPQEEMTNSIFLPPKLTVSWDIVHNQHVHSGLQTHTRGPPAHTLPSDAILQIIHECLWVVLHIKQIKPGLGLGQGKEDGLSNAFGQCASRSRGQLSAPPLPGEQPHHSQLETIEFGLSEQERREGLTERPPGLPVVPNPLSVPKPDQKTEEGKIKYVSYFLA